MNQTVTPSPASVWLNAEGGAHRVICIANRFLVADPEFPLMVVFDTPDGTVLACSAQRFSELMTPAPVEEPPPEEPKPRKKKGQTP